ncbi:hexose carrier protein [Saitoella complicata NRRL Y-17804]|uniref:Major facilitator superfamily (MFS) profile domain-containing protein n=1 Tax=Saitoella complicata (strain BCRC 22490 / CBS 7301 / JCM 7358 / NBRC 10748 / NRRL Y-17804) TaxID=698492 RepID=A0A0E9NIM7_SAICN|nr:hexose carrier protein [Saitoella complicata NRRL Y-17804]ODQ50951.1 hexose carrier protein [Saitoella complicata NRRL Y-17804]GAO49668.1 hypothetical protein G7K_3815-t1 [Saitoella complicata NRRL Y-17804]
MARGLRGLRGTALNFAIAVIAGTAFWLFGYDMGVMGGIITEQPFLSVLPEMKDPNILGIVIASFELGCLVGALACLEVGDRLGRRKTVVMGMALIAIGGAMQAGANGIALFTAGRVVAGLGMGFDVATVPTWQAECSKSHNRGWLVMIEGAMCTIGVACSLWVGYGAYFLQPSQAAWRLPVAIQCIPAVTVFVCIMFLPESPRWLIKHGHIEEATEILSRLVDKPIDHPDVVEERDQIVATFEAQKGEKPFSYRELLEGGKTQTFRRVALGFFIQSAQQLSGINMVSTYANKIITDSFGLPSEMSHLLAAAGGTEYAICSCISAFLVEYFGRRRMFMWTAAGMAASFCIIPALLSTGSRTNQLVGAGFLFVFNTFFGLCWVGGPFLYSAEIAPLRVRSQANAIASAGNWIFCFIVVMIIPPAFANIGYHTYIIFAIINASFIPVIYFYLPETKGRSLEEMDVIFAAGGNPVKVERSMPKGLSAHEARVALGLDAELSTSPLPEHKMEDMKGETVYIERV